MGMEKAASLRILSALLREPTAPYFEHRVRGALRRVLESAGVPCSIDASGNLLARYRRGRAKPVAFTAHMDHPGFEVVWARGRRARARWNGQLPAFDLKGLRLALWRPGEGAAAAARFGTAVVLRGDGRRPLRRKAGLTLRSPVGTRPGFFGYADLDPFSMRGTLIRSKGHDDVAGCGVIAACLARLARRRLPADVLAVFTRAEEEGFKGAFAAVENRSLPKSRPVVVLECSKAVAGVAQGAGPVIRVGDKACVFDADMAAACVEAAQRLQAAEKSFLFQRKLMDGGTCEATVFCLAGFRALCLALPLGNYHNNGERGVACETIDRRDFLAAVDLLSAFACGGLDPGGARTRKRRSLWKRFLPAERRRLLESR